MNKTQSKEDECKKQEALEEASRLLSLIANETYDTAMEKKAKAWLRSFRACVFL